MTSDHPPIPILLSGLPGKMSEAVAVRILGLPTHEFSLLGNALGSDSRAGSAVVIAGTSFTMHSRSTLPTIPPQTIAIDYSVPAAALENVSMYCSLKIPFILGTTGFDREEAVRLVEASDICAVIAPNMAVPIILLQAAIQDLSRRYPGALKGYSGSIVESHQSTKKDTSGTARAFLTGLRDLGLPLEIQSVRDPWRQRNEFAVPQEHLAGHAYHYYQIGSEDAGVELELSHRVHGRSVYVEGTITALRYLQGRLEAGDRGRVFSMIDVLSGAV